MAEAFSNSVTRAAGIVTTMTGGAIGITTNLITGISTVHVAVNDLVDTGKTLEANGLVPYERIADISSRLIVNKASLKLNNKLLKPMINKFSQSVS